MCAKGRYVSLEWERCLRNAIRKLIRVPKTVNIGTVNLRPPSGFGFHFDVCIKRACVVICLFIPQMFTAAWAGPHQSQEPRIQSLEPAPAACQGARQQEAGSDQGQDLHPGTVVSSGNFTIAPHIHPRMRTLEQC